MGQGHLRAAVVEAPDLGGDRRAELRPRAAGMSRRAGACPQILRGRVVLRSFMALSFPLASLFGGVARMGTRSTKRSYGERSVRAFAAQRGQIPWVMLAEVFLST
jgi:hypothetical protein